MEALRFGYRRHPEGLRAVWGARLIAPNDLLWDRQDLVYEDDAVKAELVAWLNTGALKQALDRLGRDRVMLHQEDREFLVFEDATGRIVGYVAGWLKHHMPAVTGTGRVVTDAEFEALADEAETGYDAEQLRRAASDPRALFKAGPS